MRRMLIEFIFPWIKRSRLKKEEAQRMIDECTRKIEENTKQIHLHTRDGYLCCVRIVNSSWEGIREAEELLKSPCTPQQEEKLLLLIGKYKADIEKYSKEIQIYEENPFIRGTIVANRNGIL